MPKISPVKYELLVRIFVEEGFVYQRTRGDHLVYSKTGCSRPLIIPMYQEVPVFIIKNLLRTAGISRERYFQLFNI